MLRMQEQPCIEIKFTWHCNLGPKVTIKLLVPSHCAGASLSGKLLHIRKAVAKGQLCHTTLTIESFFCLATQAFGKALCYLLLVSLSSAHALSFTLRC